MRRLLLLVLVMLTASACSQAAALAPVSGGREALVRFAGNDVLVGKGVAILRAPVCTQGPAGVTCTGTTADAQPITVTGPPGDPARMVVTVGATTLYDGPVQDVIDSSGRPS